MFATTDGLGSLSSACSSADELGVPCFVLGKGSNILVSSSGFAGLVIQLGVDFKRVKVEAPCIEAGGAVSLSQVARSAFHGGLGGLTWSIGIPGTVGGAVVTNAGAFGGSIADVVDEVTVLGSGQGLRRLRRDEITFAYRQGSLPLAGVIVEAILRLHPRDQATLRGEISRYSRQRKATQPSGQACAGSVFRNPPGMAAGRLIEQSGCKGMKRGGAMVSEIHSNFIVNTGQASPDDIYELIAVVREAVRRDSGVVLETEVGFVGDFARGVGGGTGRE